MRKPVTLIGVQYSECYDVTMRNTRKKKTPVTTQKHHSSSSNPNTTRTLIRRFHVLLKKQRQLERNGRDAKDVKQEIEQLGGLATYQRMSSIGQGKDRGGGSEQVLIRWLIGMGLNKSTLRYALVQCAACPCDWHVY